MKELLEKRRASQPLEFPSAGSTFKRPEGHFAGTLIDQCGLKGLTVGGAQVSEKHAGFVINRGGATCADVKELIRQIQERVLGRPASGWSRRSGSSAEKKGRCGHGNPHHLRPLRGREEQGGLLLEDMGFYIVDNMPAAMILKFAEFCAGGNGRYDRVALVYDVRTASSFTELFDVLDKLKDMEAQCRMLFLEASPEVHHQAV